MKSELLTRDSEPATPNPRRIRRIYVYWSMALTLLLALGLFCWLVVVPVWSTETILTKVEADTLSRESAITELGGTMAARSRLRGYLRLPSSLTSNRPAAAWVLTGCGVSVESDLLVLLRDPETRVRRIAMVALGNMRSSRAVEPLIEIVTQAEQVRPATDESIMEVVFASMALGEIGNVRAGPHLLLLVDHEVGPVQTATIGALRKIGYVQAASKIARQLTSRHRAVRLRAAQALAKIGSDKEVPALKKTLTDEFPAVRQAAVEALEKIREKEKAQP